MTVQELTRDHDIIFCLLDELSHYAITAEAPQLESMKGRCADMLLDYCSDHFSMEEAEMRSMGFPHVKAHIVEHEKIHKSLQESLYGMKCVDLLELLDFLRNAIIRHIITWDESFITWAKDVYEARNEKLLLPETPARPRYFSRCVSLEERELLLPSSI